MNVAQLHPRSLGIGPAPERLGSAHARAWDAIVASAPPGALSDANRLFVELTAHALARYWEGTDRRVWGTMARGQLATCKVPPNEINRLLGASTEKEQSHA